MKTQILAFFGLMASTATFATDLVKCDKYFSAGYEQTWVSDDTLSGTYGALDVQFQFTDEMYRTYLGNWSHMYGHIVMGYGATDVRGSILDNNSFVIDLQVGFPWQVIDNHYLTGGAGLLAGMEIGPASANHTGLGLLTYAHLLPDGPVSVRLQHEWNLVTEGSTSSSAQAYHQKFGGFVAFGNYLVGGDYSTQDSKHRRFGITLAYGAMGRML